MDKYISNINISLLIPATLVFILLILHCYLYRGMRLTFAFFGCVLLHSFGRQVVYTFTRRLSGSLTYFVLGTPFKIFSLPLVVYMGWAITFYLSWYLAERILKKIGRFSDRIFPTIIWSMLIAGALSYCIETTAFRAGWWLWTRFDPRFKEFLLVPYSSLQAWFSNTAQFLLIFFLSECSEYKKQWWRVFLYTFAIWMVVIIAVIYSPINFGQFALVIKIYHLIRILLPILLMFFYPIKLQFTGLGPRGSERKEFLYNALPLFTLSLILFTCIIIDILIIRKPELLISKLSLVLLIMLSIKKMPLWLIFVSVAFSIIYGGQRFYILSIPSLVFLMFIIYIGFSERNIKGKGTPDYSLEE